MILTHFTCNSNYFLTSINKNNMMIRDLIYKMWYFGHFTILHDIINLLFSQWMRSLGGLVEIFFSLYSQKQTWPLMQSSWTSTRTVTVSSWCSTSPNSGEDCLVHLFLPHSTSILPEPHIDYSISSSVPLSLRHTLWYNSRLWWDQVPELSVGLQRVI